MSRITNSMAADQFFNQQWGAVRKRHLEGERFGMSVGQAKNKLRPKKVVKQDKPVIEFESWQIELATKVLKGKP